VTDVLPSVYEEPQVPVSGVAVLAGVLAAFGAFALLVSLVAAFANGAHSHQVLSGATWKQQGTGGGIVTAIVLFLVWGAGGFVAARMARREGLRHGVWVFIVGVVLITVVGAAITWLPDTTAILRNLRLLGFPVRRSEWRDVGTVAGIASLIGAAAGAAAGGWFALRQPAPARAVVPAAAPTPVPATPAPSPAAAPSPPPPRRPAAEPEPEPSYVRPSLFEQEPDRDEEPAAEETPAWLQFIQDRERATQDREPVVEEPQPRPSVVPAPWVTDEPAPTFLDEAERVQPEPRDAASLWPEQPEPVGPAPDDAWALPDDEGAHPGGDEVERAFPPSPAIPIPEQEPEPEQVIVPPLGEHADWADDDDDLYRAPPETSGEDSLQNAPEAPPPAPDVDPEEVEARRRQQEEAARAYRQALEDQ
jgi:hypothetical protein